MNDEQSAFQPPAVPVIVGVGASAVSPGSIERFFSKLALAPHLAVVLAVQHREALDEAHLAEAVARLDGLRISEPEDDTPIEGGAIYLCATDAITTVRDGHFAVRPAEGGPGDRGTIDSLLVSLAEDRAVEAVGVVLAGTGGDGTLGFAAIKDQGGLTIAERLAEEGDLADSGKAVALADFILPAEDAPAQIEVYLRHLQRLRERRDLNDAVAAAGSALTGIADILRDRTGNDFHGYKPNTFLRRVRRRMQVVGADTIEGYVELLRANKEEAHNLFNDLLIGVTQFFRDKKEFDLVEREVVPRIFEGKSAVHQLRVWVIGCATGEEAYSIAILLRERMATLDSVPHVQIFATDLDGRALAAARVGRYRTDIEKDVSTERLARWFVREGDTYVVAKELREMCIFSQHNVIRDAPFSRLDLVSCRNLLIYLSAELQNRVIPLFHFALLPDRYLMLGNSENVSRHPKLFAPVDRRARIFQRLETGRRIVPDLPIAPAASPSPHFAPPHRGADVGLDRRAQRVAERHAPAYVIADEQFNVLHFSGRTGRFLEPVTGTASLDLLNLVHRDLRVALRAALSRARETGRPAQADQVLVAREGDRIVVDVAVEPLEERSGEPRAFVVLFKDGAIRPTADGVEGGPVSGEHVERIEAELRATRERLEATIEELESTNEELKSSNEEYQSLNEELQSANEELQTSREELQSVNEELTTVNGELAHRVGELTRATSDLKNFLEATQIATAFLDNDLRVTNFTPAVTQVLHLVDTDVGRPIAHIKARVPIEELFEDMRGVLRTLSPVERALAAPETGARFIVRILPYRSVDNFIAGVVVTFTDVTAVTRAEERQRLLLAELQHRVRNTLGVVRSIARRSAETSETVEDYSMHLDGRLNAFARTQALVTRDPEAGVDLSYLVAEELLAYAAHEGEKVSIAGPPIRFQPKVAETIGLAVHELATNALKYGALSKPAGRIDVAWTINRDDGGQRSSLHFDWREADGPVIGGPPTRRGFGTELLERTLAFELKARTRLAFEPTGLHCTIELPLTDRVLVLQRTPA